MLGLCANCNRHVRDEKCPFCGGAVARTARGPIGRGSRTARIVGIAAIGVACGGTTSPTDGGASDAHDDFSTQPPYGAVIPDSGLDAQTSDASDAGDAADAPDETGIALYGAPPPPDGG